MPLVTLSKILSKPSHASTFDSTSTSSSASKQPALKTMGISSAASLSTSSVGRSKGDRFSRAFTFSLVASIRRRPKSSLSSNILHSDRDLESTDFSSAYVGYEDDDYGEPDVEAEEIRRPSGLGRRVDDDFIQREMNVKENYSSKSNIIRPGTRDSSESEFESDSLDEIRYPTGLGSIRLQAVASTPSATNSTRPLSTYPDVYLQLRPARSSTRVPASPRLSPRLQNLSASLCTVLPLITLHLDTQALSALTLVNRTLGERARRLLWRTVRLNLRIQPDSAGPGSNRIVGNGPRTTGLLEMLSTRDVSQFVKELELTCELETQPRVGTVSQPQVRARAQPLQSQHLSESIPLPLAPQRARPPPLILLPNAVSSVRRGDDTLEFLSAPESRDMKLLTEPLPVLLDSPKSLIDLDPAGPPQPQLLATTTPAPAPAPAPIVTRSISPASTSTSRLGFRNLIRASSASLLRSSSTSTSTSNNTLLTRTSSVSQTTILTTNITPISNTTTLATNTHMSQTNSHTPKSSRLLQSSAARLSRRVSVSVSLLRSRSTDALNGVLGRRGGGSGKSGNRQDDKGVAKEELKWEYEPSPSPSPSSTTTTTATASSPFLRPSNPFPPTPPPIASLSLDPRISSSTDADSGITITSTTPSTTPTPTPTRLHMHTHRFSTWTPPSEWATSPSSASLAYMNPNPDQISTLSAGASLGRATPSPPPPSLSNARHMSHIPSPPPTSSLVIPPIKACSLSYNALDAFVGGSASFANTSFSPSTLSPGRPSSAMSGSMPSPSSSNPSQPHPHPPPQRIHTSPSLPLLRRQQGQAPPSSFPYSSSTSRFPSASGSAVSISPNIPSTNGTTTPYSATHAKSLSIPTLPPTPNTPYSAISLSAFPLPPPLRVVGGSVLKNVGSGLGLDFESVLKVGSAAAVGNGVGKPCSVEVNGAAEVRERERNQDLEHAGEDEDSLPLPREYMLEPGDAVRGGEDKSNSRPAPAPAVSLPTSVLESSPLLPTPVSLPSPPFQVVPVLQTATQVPNFTPTPGQRQGLGLCQGLTHSLKELINLEDVSVVYTTSSESLAVLGLASVSSEASDTQVANSGTDSSPTRTMPLPIPVPHQLITETTHLLRNTFRGVGTGSVKRIGMKVKVKSASGYEAVSLEDVSLADEKDGDRDVSEDGDADTTLGRGLNLGI
ncbi:hypothetical protein BU17DRAFT_98609 [Hysterangium stoloniferum]|nr:hypothetical protein BU17DRAFT_98609 [Hysterangium stoloniferum]